MPLAPNALTTLEAVCGELGMGIPSPGTAEAKDLERRINAASEAIERYCGRNFSRASVTEKVRGFGRARLVLSRTPVVAVASVHLDGVLVPAEDYELSGAEAGFVAHVRGVWEWTADVARGISCGLQPGTERALYAVAYSGGYVLPKDEAGGSPRTLPYDLEEVCIRTVATAYRRPASDTSLEEYAGGGLNTAIGRGLGGMIPDSAVYILQPYRRLR